MPQPEKPRVVVGTPSRGQVQIEASKNLRWATRGGCTIVDPYSAGSLLARMFNNLWCNALNGYEAGAAQYFCLNHDDVEVRTLAWLDLMIAEMQRTGAAILSAVIAMKGPGDLTSTALHRRGTWETRKLSIDECAELPKSFCVADVHALLPNLAPSDLVINSGLLLVDLSRPEFLSHDDRGELNFFFTVQDRCVRNADGQWIAEAWSEDWDFSARCNAAGLPVYATTAVEVIHHGGGQWSNQRKRDAA